MSYSHSQWQLPTNLRFGTESLKEAELPRVAHLALVLSGSLAETRSVGALLQRLKDQETQVQLLIRSGGEPESEELDRLFLQMSPETEAVMGLGGGSTLDTAKFLAMLAISGGKSADYDRGGDGQITGALPIYLVPTTMGSGSEATHYAVAANSRTRRKFTIGHPSLFPQIAWIDPALCLGVSETTLVAGALDSFIHCLEAALNTQTHLLVEPIALEGMRLVNRTLPEALHYGLDLERAASLARASLYGGMAIAHSRTGLVHTMAVALAEYLPTAHGALNGWLVPAVVRFNAAHYGGRLAEVISRVTDIEWDSDADAMDVLLEWLQPLLPGETPWAGRSWTDTEIDHLVERVLQDGGLPTVNPRPVTAEGLHALYEEVLRGDA